MRSLKPILWVTVAALVAACEPGPGFYGTPPEGVSEEAWKAQVDAKRQAEKDYMHGPRGGGGSGGD